MATNNTSSSPSSPPTIHTAAQAGDVEAVVGFLAHDATLLNQTDNKGMTALHWAALRGRSAVVSHLLTQEGIDVNAPVQAPDTKYHGKTTLQWAVERGHCEVVRMLFDAGAEYKPIGTMNFDLIHLAARIGHLDMVKLLLERDPTGLNKTDALGQTALIWAAADGHEKIVRFLLTQEGIDLHASTQNPEKKEHGRNAFHWAIEEGYYAVVSMLYHADPCENNTKAVLDFIETVDDAFRFMIIDSRNKALLENELHVGDWLDAWTAQSPQHYYYYKKKGQSPAFYAEIDRNTGQTTLFHPGKPAQDGEWVDFVSANNEHRLVKYSSFDRTLDRLVHISRHISEKNMRERLYPKRNLSFLIESMSTQGKETGIAEVRDSIEGETLADFFLKIQSVDALTNLFFLITAEMFRVHKEYLLHVGCTADQILVSPKGDTIMMLDFSRAGWRWESLKKAFPDLHEQAPHLAPELFNATSEETNVQRDTRQDVYALGYLFYSLVGQFANKHELYSCFPSVVEFINAALDPQPEKRPLLHEFSNQLLKERHRFSNTKDILPCPEGFDFIHYAAGTNQVNVARRLLAGNKARLNARDAHGQTPLILAARMGHAEFVAHLLGYEGIDLQACTQKPGSDEDGKTALQWAIDGDCYEVMSMLYHVDPDERNKQIISKKAIFSGIRVEKQAFAFMAMDARNKALLEEDPRLRALIYEKSDPDEPYFYYYKVRGSRPSFYLEIDKNTGVSKFFGKGKKLGGGVHGDVVDFVSETGEHRVVKYRKEVWTSSSKDQQKAIEKCRKEQLFRQRAYPGTNRLFDFHKKNQYSVRDVSDFIEGGTLMRCFPKIKTIDEIIRIFLKVIEEYMMLHAKNILHADCKDDNIMVSNACKITIIDFGLSCWLTDETMNTFKDERRQYPRVAPELFYETAKQKEIKPDTSQDVYSIGYLFRNLLGAHVQKWQTYKAVPSLRTFVLSAMEDDPSKRPALGDFHAQLTGEYAAFVEGVKESSEVAKPGIG